MTPTELRREIRAGRWTGQTAGAAPGFVQANIVVLPDAQAAAFRAFCLANAQACPVLEVTPPGDPHPRIAAGADLRSDLPRYHVYRDGELAAEPADVADLWQDDMVAFVIGCSFSFEHALLAQGIPLRHVAEGRNVAMYRTTVPCTAAGPFQGPLVVSMRPLPRSQLEAASAICARMPEAHGEPVSIGDPERLGIADLQRPDFGDPVAIREDEVPVFWACGVTGVEAARGAALPLLITHAPGHMFVSDRPIAA
jgi:uncharacterized protein YcsI (UPF0317 family)